MGKKRKIDIKELQENLYKIGANISLIKMPAIIERIKDDYISLDEIDIGIEGEIITPEGTFYKKDDGAEYQTEDFVVEIDKYGIESRISDKDTKAIISRKNGEITYDEPYDGYFGPFNFKYPDTAIPTLQKVHEYAVVYQEDLKNLGTLEENRAYLLKNYPQTVGWFLERNLLLEGNINLPQISNYSIEESENNRLLFYHNKINEFKKIEEKEDKKIELLIQFADLEGLPRSIIDSTLDYTDILLNNIKKSNQNNLESTLEKGRQSLNYYKFISSLKRDARKQIKKDIIHRCIANVPDTKRAKVIMKEKIKKFFAEHSDTERTQEMEKDREE